VFYETLRVVGEDMEQVPLNRVSGQVVTQEANLAVPNVVVVVLDLDRFEENQKR
jgi:hypothetical protein